MNEVRDLKKQVEQLGARNTKLAGLLQQSRAKLGELANELNMLAEPASTYGVFLSYAGNDNDAEVFTGGRHMRLKVSPTVKPHSLIPGQSVRLGDGLVVVEACGYETAGQLVSVAELVGHERAIVTTASGEEHIIVLAPHLRSKLRMGDTLLVDLKAGIATELIDKTDVAQLSLEEIPDVDFGDIGGLDSQISEIRDSVELPFMHPELYRQFDLRPPKGVLLYGPPGCGKTLIAKAVANSLSKSLGAQEPSYFINVKGPELLNKFVGETERKIRLVFERARSLASLPGNRPVVVFFDEMESIFRVRGSGVSSDMETTVVPQLLTELDGVEDLRNVIVIGATNREELIDPAIMRPGRLDIKIRVNRPDKQSAREIFRRHFPDTVPHEGCVEELITSAVDVLYANQPFIKLNFDDETSRVLHYRDFVSGAMIANIISRAKKLAIKQWLKHGDGQPAVSAAHLQNAIEAEQAESEHIPNSTNPDEWLKILGSAARNRRVVSIEHLIPRSN